MSKSTVIAGALVLALAFAMPARAGIYTTIDRPDDTAWSRDYINVFEGIINQLGNIAADKLMKEADSPIRERYLLLDNLGREGLPNLKTWQQQLNYGAVLIRRNKAYAATELLQPLAASDKKNFLILSQLATARFLSGNDYFPKNAPHTMKEALELWPANLEKIDPELERFLRVCKLESDYELDRFKRIETYFERFMRNRIKEEFRAKQKKPVPDAVDPIFRDEDSDDKKPLTFLNENGNFEVGRIAALEKAKLPKDAIEIVEQLLIWMPTDQRLKWLLGEVFNASIMDCKEGDERNERIRNTLRIFQQMNDPLNRPAHGAQAIKHRHDTLKTIADKLPPPRGLDPKQFGIVPIDQPDPTISNADWWRLLAVGFITGLAVGMFAIWQFQEVRRRRQGR